jgi:Flp pilus assembly protein TadD
MLINTVALLAKDDQLSSAQGIERYKNLVQTHPEEAAYWNALGYYYLKSGDLQRGEVHFLKAIELDGTYPIPHNNLGVVYLKQGLYEQAEQEFRRAVRLNPHYCKAQYNMAVALFHQKRYMEAGKAYLKARELDRDYVARRNNRENMERKIEKALEQADGDDQSTQELKRMRQWFAPFY